ncbi:tRNA epoxyqueuosine(34) reductase QueG [Ectothiorhodospiraceae bacterium BW-2]|nr:tRNA epoxyqueuosine(34) reductase QueG [Ectothiorhodospiraceae bacterium BW-2]
MISAPPHSPEATLQQQCQQAGLSLVGIAPLTLAEAGARLQQWLAAQFHGEMAYMAKHGAKRWQPQQLVPGTVSAIMVTLDYLPEPQAQMWQQLQRSEGAYLSRYSLGRDYHKVLRRRLKQLAEALQQAWRPFGYRIFVDSGPVMEKPLAQLAGLGWIGKHTNLVNRERGSWFFIGTLLTDLPLKPDQPASNHCGRCQRCVDICPTGAIIAPYRLDARRCLSYLTIEHHGAIPLSLRPQLGNRIVGCDDCQLICPWNRFAKLTAVNDFLPRHRLDQATLLELFLWDEATFLAKSEGMVLRRLGYRLWQRNLAVALGNGPKSEAVVAALQHRLSGADPMVAEHIVWALTYR